MNQESVFPAVCRLIAEYARQIDNDELEAWPDFFADPCLYRITTEADYRKGYEAGAIYADSQAMLRDRVTSLRQANIYEGQRYRHLVGMPVVTNVNVDEASAETSFAVYRIRRDGRTDLFSTGRYVDRIRIRPHEKWTFSQRIVVCDSAVFDTLIAIPI